MRSWLLPSQSIEGSVEEKTPGGKPDVADVIARFDDVDIAIVGIGILEPSQLLKTSGNYYHEDMLQVLADRGAVGDICLHYYDKHGQPVLQDDEDPVIGMALDKIKNARMWWHWRAAKTKLPPSKAPCRVVILMF